eukprot:TRINITY_DN2491_c1_g3_i1.p1 TRINITY_DN2491_c1_g3~~TRINITY_DN2491_c1_g3_i1.p1  ORF type:complete len:583 (+),score=153.18 TRINITY_DN2491_c1_g3_i1:2-1750(+)
MRGEWFDSVSCLMTFSRDAKINKGKETQVTEFRHTLVRLVSLMHGSALDEISDNGGESRYEVLDIHGLDVNTLKFLRDCKKNGFNRVEALQHMIQVLVTHNHHSGVLTIPPPILSRIYQTLSRGLVNLLNARKIKDTSFPFPYAQIIYLLLIIQMVWTPLLVTQFAKEKLVAAIFAWLPVFGFHCVNFTAIELEMPFGTDDNDLPLRNFQTEMNEALLMLIHEMADHLPHTSESAAMDFEKLETYLRGIDPDEYEEHSQVEALKKQTQDIPPSKRRSSFAVIAPPRRQEEMPSNSSSFMEHDFFGIEGEGPPVPFRDRNIPLNPERRASTLSELSALGPPVASPQTSAVAAPPPAEKKVEPVVPAETRPPEAKAVESPMPVAPPTPTPTLAPSSSLLPNGEKALPSEQPKLQDALLADNGKTTGSFLNWKPGAEKAVVAAASDPEMEFTKLYLELIQKTDSQVQAMKKNTESINELSTNLPKTLGQHCNAFVSLSRAVLRALDTTAVAASQNGNGLEYSGDFTNGINGTAEWDYAPKVPPGYGLSPTMDQRSSLGGATKNPVLPSLEGEHDSPPRPPGVSQL